MKRHIHYECGNVGTYIAHVVLWVLCKLGIAKQVVGKEPKSEAGRNTEVGGPVSETAYVVVARFGMDDIPLRIFASRTEAEQWCSRPESAQEANWTAAGCGIDPSWTVTAFSVCRFEQGTLAAIEVVADVEEPQ